MDVSGELATVGTAAASALVAAMLGDSWRGFRDWLGRWFGHEGERTAASRLDRLDRDRETLLAVPEQDREERAGRLSSEWAVRLQDAADEDQDAGRELLAYVQQWQAENPQAAAQVSMVSQRAKAKGKARVTQVGRDQITVNRERP